MSWWRRQETYREGRDQMRGRHFVSSSLDLCSSFRLICFTPLSLSFSLACGFRVILYYCINQYHLHWPHVRHFECLVSLLADHPFWQVVSRRVPLLVISNSSLRRNEKPPRYVTAPRAGSLARGRRGSRVVGPGVNVDGYYYAVAATKVLYSRKNCCM